MAATTSRSEEQEALPRESLPTVTVRLPLELRAHAIAQTLAAWEDAPLADWLAREIEEHLRHLWLHELNELDQAERENA